MLSTSSLRLRSTVSSNVITKIALAAASSKVSLASVTSSSSYSLFSTNQKHQNNQLMFNSNYTPVFVAHQSSARRFCSTNNNNKSNKNNKNDDKKDAADATATKKTEETKVVTPEEVEAKLKEQDVDKKSEVAAEKKDDESASATKTVQEDSKKAGDESLSQQQHYAGSVKKDEAAQADENGKHTAAENNKPKLPPPKGFELFFLPPFSRPPAKDAPPVTTVNAAESQRIMFSDRYHNQATTSRRLTQFLFFAMGVYIFSKFWYRNSGAHQLGGEAFYYYDRTAQEREEAKKKKKEQQDVLKTSGSNTDQNKDGEGKDNKDGEGEGSESSTNKTQETSSDKNESPIPDHTIYFPDAEVKYITVDPEQHAAVFYSESGQKMFTQRFIDFGNWLRDIEKRADPEKGPFVRMEVAIGFPIVAIAFLWLMPVLGRFYRGVNFGLGRARNEAKAALQKQQNASELETPTNKGRFRFKKENDIKTRLDDVAGLTEAKHEVTEIIDFLKGPEKYSTLGAKLPKGVLIDGPPGVGKTLLARAVAGEAGLNFVSCSGSEFDEVYVGVGAMRVRELFKSAREHAPCVVFIDEIDTFGKKRRRDAKGNSRGTINALLSELDGFKESSRIMVLAATNRADILDDALTRSGRFDRKISVDLPPHKDRVAIALVHLRPLKLNPSLELNRVAESIAALTPGCSGADLYNICNEAAIVGSRMDKDYVDMECFHKAMDRIMIGLERKARKFEKHEKERLAIHEAGHVVLSWFLKTTDPVMKATIAPRGGSTEGKSRKLPHERYIITQEALHERMIQRLGGYVAEEFFFTNISQNAAEDLAVVTNEAKSEICVYGMNPANVGHFGYPMNEEDTITKPYSGKKANIVDAEISNLVTNISDTAREMMKKYQNEVRMVAGVLMKQETVTAKELWVLLGERPQMSPEFRKYLESEA